MNERALLVAKGFCQVMEDAGSPPVDTLHVYRDGVVMALTVTADRHLDVRKGLLRVCPTFEEARIEDLSVFVIPMPDGVTTKPEDLPSFVVVLTKALHDHRWEEFCTLDDVVELQRQYLATSQGTNSERQ